MVKEIGQGILRKFKGVGIQFTVKTDNVEKMLA